MKKIFAELGPGLAVYAVVLVLGTSAFLGAFARLKSSSQSTTETATIVDVSPPSMVRRTMGKTRVRIGDDRVYALDGVYGSEGERLVLTFTDGILTQVADFGTGGFVWTPHVNSFREESSE